jgi:hypothetical protein
VPNLTYELTCSYKLKKFCSPFFKNYNIASSSPSTENHKYLHEKAKFTGMKHGVSKWLILCSNCTKTHLRASVDQKNFFRLAIARHEGRKPKGRGEGGGVRGKGGGEGRG